MSALSAWEFRSRTALERFVPETGQADAETSRRAQLFVAFSMLGVFFGSLFGGFYLLIEHPWGAATVFASTIAVAGAPWIVRTRGLEVAGNLYAAVLVLGFSGLTAIEGGIHGHAVAWLAVVPLCACILVDQRTCRLWCCICLGVMAGFCALAVWGIRLPALYPREWESAITAAGYLSLTVFMSLLGVAFETGRRRALQRLQDAHDALSEANARLQHLNKERSEFLGIAAHDLRNPLHAIFGFAHLLQQYCSDAPKKQHDALNHILTASGRMRDLLDRLLSVQAIEEGNLELSLEPCDLVALVGAVVEEHRPAALAKQIALGFTPPPGPARAVADCEATKQVIDNLLSNAIKFSLPGRPVEVRIGASREAGQWRVEVQDAGPGLSEADQCKLYGKFARLSARPTAGESSNGLGLSIVKRLAEAMGGQLACRSKLGEGSVFSLSLKACDPPAGIAPRAGPSRAGDEAAPDSAVSREPAAGTLLAVTAATQG